MNPSPLSLSIIMPVFNGAAFLPEAVKNIKQQGYQPLEIVIVDDGSTDETARIAAEFKDRVNYVYQTNQGPSAARNKGLEIAGGEIIGFLDVDDQWPEGTLQVMMDNFNQHPETEIVMGKVKNWWVRDDKREEFSAPYIGVNIGAALFRKEVFAKIGNFDPNLRYGEDIDLFMRAREQGVKTMALDRVTLIYQLHQTNMTRGKNPVALNVLKALKKSLDRRREQSAEGLAQVLPEIKQPDKNEEKPENPEKHD